MYLFYSSIHSLQISFNCLIDGLHKLFYSLRNSLWKYWWVELDFLRLLIVFIQDFCEKISNRNIPDPNEQNWQFLSRLWDAEKIRGDGKCYCQCSQCRGFNRRIILITKATKQCREHGHDEEGNEYRPFVSLAL